MSAMLGILSSNVAWSLSRFQTRRHAQTKIQSGPGPTVLLKKA